MSGAHDFEHWMRTALASARRASGRTHPNPSVGAIVQRGGRLLGRGATRPPGGPHAEVIALRSAQRKHGGRALRGATLVVTLEPCCFEGRTGPCTDAIIEAGIGRIVVGCRDPHPRVNGRGLRSLRAAGVEVVQGVLEAECREHHRGFFSVCERGRPFVSLKLASTLDGRIATRSGDSRWITGPEARRWVHARRAVADAIMVGSGTALADDPDLGARRGERVIRRPARVLVDSRLRVPASAALYRLISDDSPTYVITRTAARGRRAVSRAGAQLIDVAGKPGALDLEAALEQLAEAGLTNVFVEGGGGLAAALLRLGLVDEIHWITAPRLIGGDGREAVGGLGVDALSDSIGLEISRVRRLGDDWHVQARVAEPKSRGRSRGGVRRR
jgi:diaminohydroxyphosphoribosylaminopyrimidine deaminase/5-amino-6-(5-phosphoribosylamino)uracil reductase